MSKDEFITKLQALMDEAGMENPQLFLMLSTLNGLVGAALVGQEMRIASAIQPVILQIRDELDTMRSLRDKILAASKSGSMGDFTMPKEVKSEDDKFFESFEDKDLIG